MRFAAISSEFSPSGKILYPFPPLLFIVRLLQCLFRNLVILHKQFRHSADLVLLGRFAARSSIRLNEYNNFSEYRSPSGVKTSAFSFPVLFSGSVTRIPSFFSSLKSHGSPSAAEADTNHRSAFAYRIRIRGWCKAPASGYSSHCYSFAHIEYTPRQRMILCVDLIVKFLYFIFHNLPHSIPFGTEWSIRQDFEIVNLYFAPRYQTDMLQCTNSDFHGFSTNRQNNNHRLPGAVPGICIPSGFL